MFEKLVNAMPSQTNYITELMAWRWAESHPYLYTVIKVSGPSLYVVIVIAGAAIVRGLFRGRA